MPDMGLLKWFNEKYIFYSQIQYWNYILNNIDCIG